MPESLNSLDRLSELTRRYATWTRDEGGLPLVWGGLTLILLVGHRMFLNALAAHLNQIYPHPMTVAEAHLQGWKDWFQFVAQIRPVLLALLPLSWVLGKDWFRAKLYQSFGLVEPETTLPAIWICRLSRTFIILSGIMVPIMAVWFSGEDLTQHMSPLELILGLTACWALPVLTWTRVRGWQESLVWTPMALMALASFWSPVLWRGYLGYMIVPLLIAMVPVSIGIGLAQHFRYRQLRRELEAAGSM